MKRWLAVAGVVTVLTLFMPTPAYADADQGPIVEALKAQHLYIAPELLTITPEAVQRVTSTFDTGGQIYLTMVPDTTQQDPSSRTDFSNRLYKSINCGCAFFVLFELKDRSRIAYWYQPAYFSSDEYNELKVAIESIASGPIYTEQYITGLIARTQEVIRLHPSPEPTTQAAPEPATPPTEATVSPVPTSGSAGKKTDSWFKRYVVDKVGMSVFVLSVISLILIVAVFWYLGHDIVPKNSIPRLENQRRNLERLAEPTPAPRHPAPVQPATKPIAGRARAPFVWQNMPKAVVMPLQAGNPPHHGPYTIIGRLGAGGMGEVFLGETGDKSPRYAAIKLIASSLLDNDSIHERFRREVDNATQLGKASAYFPYVIESDLEAERPSLTTEFVDGRNLDDLVRQGLFRPDQATTLMLEMARALAYSHGLKIVHRDIKPSNILLPASNLKIIDFGLAHALDRTRLTTYGWVGTSGYTPPEQILDQELGTAGDIFSLGATVAFAATGRGPFAGSNPAAVNHNILGGKCNLSGIPRDLADIIKQCLRVNPNDRPTAHDIISYLTK